MIRFFFASSFMVAIAFGAFACSGSDSSTSSSSGATPPGVPPATPPGTPPATPPGTPPGTPPTPPSSGALFAITGGTFDKLTLTPVSGAAFLSKPASGTELIVIISDKPGACPNVNHQNETTFSIDALSDKDPFPPATYTQTGSSNPGQVDPAMSKLGATCNAVGQDYGADNGSTVVIQTVTATRVTGTFDITFSNAAGTMQGTFDVPICTQAFDNTCLP